MACAGLAVEASAQVGHQRGERGQARGAGQVNFTEAARREKLSAPPPHVEEPATRVHLPRRLPDNLPAPAGVPSVREVKRSAGALRLEAQQQPSLLTSPGAASSFPGSDSLGVIPPDTHGAAGPNHLVVAVNGRVRVQTRDGITLSTVGLTQFLTAAPAVQIATSAFDPRVFYDTLSGRWILVAASDSRSASSSILLAVSQGPDPTAVWNVFQVDADADNKTWADYPNVGFNKDLVVVQANMFPNPDTSPAPPFASNIFVFDKARLMAGGPGDHTRFNRTDLSGTQVPAVTFDPAQPAVYLVNNWSSGGGSLRVFAVERDAAGTVTLNTGLPQPVAAEGWSTGPGGDFGPQLDTARRVQNNDQRIQSAVFRHGSLWCAQTIFLPAGGQPLRAAVQWWEINPLTGVILQRGRIDDPLGENFHAFPSIAVNKDRDVLVGYSRFSANQYVSGNYSFRAAADAPGAMREGVVLKSGEGSYERTNSGTANRWGDYSATMVDPANDTDFWTIQEFAAAPLGSAGGPQTGRYGVWWGRVSPAGAPPAAPPIAVRLSAAVPASEQAGKVEISVTRTGDVAAAALVDYATADGTASERSDYLAALGTLRFAPGETTKIVTVFLVNDAHAEPEETFSLTLSNPRNAALDAPTTVAVALTSDDPAGAPNPVRAATFDADFFVRQHYRDFFNREPDPAGLAFWTGELNSCGQSAACAEVKRINVSAAFFLSVEFQQTGYLVYRAYAAAYGPTRVGGAAPLTLREFLPDTQQAGRGVVVNAPGWEFQLENNRRVFFDNFVLRPQFNSRYPASMPAAAFVDALNTNTGGSLSQGERDTLVNDLSSGARTRAQVLRAVAEDSDFDAREKSRAFVLMQYFGYLRRNPNDAPELNLNFDGYNFWLQKLNDHGGNFVSAEMVKAFITSGEYAGRFGP